jgi:hypothetical protein
LQILTGHTISGRMAHISPRDFTGGLILPPQNVPLS